MRINKLAELAPGLLKSTIAKRAELDVDLVALGNMHLPDRTFGTRTQVLGLVELPLLAAAIRFAALPCSRPETAADERAAL